MAIFPVKLISYLTFCQVIDFIYFNIVKMYGQEFPRTPCVILLENLFIFLCSWFVRLKFGLGKREGRENMIALVSTPT